MIEDTANTQTQ